MGPLEEKDAMSRRTQDSSGADLVELKRKNFGQFDKIDYDISKKIENA